MNLNPLYRLLDRNAVPPHAKAVLLKLMSGSTCQVTPEHFVADLELQALSRLKLVALEAQGLVVAKKAYELAGINPPSTAVEVL